MNLSDEDTSTVSIQSTHAIDILAFVEADEIPLSCLETPYYLAPGPGGEEIYTLLHEVLKRTRKIGIAQVMIRARRRLAALIPCGPALVLNVLRITGKGGTSVGANLSAQRTKAAQLTEKQIARAIAVVEGMTQKWELTECLDGFGTDRGAQDGGIRENRSLYQAQRSSRPRSRVRRIYH